MQSLPSRLDHSLQTLRAGARTAVFFLKVLPMLPSRPVNWITPRPVVDALSYPTSHGDAQGQVYRPSTPGPHPGLVVCLGVVPFGVDHPQVPRLGEALARAGFAALLYWSPVMRDLRLDPVDIGDIALAYDRLLEQPYVDAERSGLLGTCVGGAFALMAAAHPRIRERVSVVTAFAPYASMWSLAVSIASATRSSGHGRTPWAVDQLTRRVYVRSLTAALESDEAERLRNGCGADADSVDTQALSENAQLIQPLLGTLEPDAAEAALQRLPAAMQERLTALTPLTYLEAIDAPLIVIGHDRDDTVIPVDESRQLIVALAGRGGVRYTEFSLFQHMDPTQRKLPPRRLAREFGKFYLYAYRMVRRVSNDPTGEARADARRAVRVKSDGDDRRHRAAPAG
jgi:dienelactone hydrolase